MTQFHQFDTPTLPPPPFGYQPVEQQPAWVGTAMPTQGILAEPALFTPMPYAVTNSGKKNKNGKPKSRIIATAGKTLLVLFLAGAGYGGWRNYQVKQSNDKILAIEVSSEPLTVVPATDGSLFAAPTGWSIQVPATWQSVPPSTVAVPHLENYWLRSDSVGVTTAILMVLAEPVNDSRVGLKVYLQASEDTLRRGIPDLQIVSNQLLNRSDGTIIGRIEYQGTDVTGLLTHGVAYIVKRPTQNAYITGMAITTPELWPTMSLELEPYLATLTTT
jgi:hypothetical protein